MDLITHLYKSPLLLLIVGVLAGCGISPNLSSSLESDELYLSSTEEFITDADYLAFASKDLEDIESDYYYEDDSYDNRYNNSYNRNFNQFGGLGLSSYFSPYGAGNYGGYGNNYGGY